MQATIKNADKIRSITSLKPLDLFRHSKDGAIYLVVEPKITLTFPCQHIDTTTGVLRGCHEFAMVEYLGTLEISD